jgi:hypothetical protein
MIDLMVRCAWERVRLEVAARSTRLGAVIVPG